MILEKIYLIIQSKLVTKRSICMLLILQIFCAKPKQLFLHHNSIYPTISLFNTIGHIKVINIYIWFRYNHIFFPSFILSALLSLKFHQTSKSYWQVECWSSYLIQFNFCSSHMSLINQLEMRWSIFVVIW